MSKDDRVVPTLYTLPGRRKQTFAWESMAVGFTGIALTNAAATQYIANKCNYDPRLGEAIGSVLYAPWSWTSWYWQFAIGDGVSTQIKEMFATASSIIVMGGAASVAAGLFVSYIKSKNQPDAIDLHGSARWGNIEDARGAHLLDKDKNGYGRGVYVGSIQDKNGATHALRHDGKEHVLVFAPTRSGKGVGLVLPTLLSWPHSVLVNDLKGENFALTSGYRKSQGHKVMRFDPAASMNRSIRDLAGYDISSDKAAEKLVGKLNRPDVTEIVKLLIDDYAKRPKDESNDNPALERVKPANYALQAIFEYDFAQIAARFGKTCAVDKTQLHAALAEHTFGHGVRFNPLSEIRVGTDKEVQDVQNIATMIVDPDGKGLSDHWAKTGFSLLVGAILHVMYSCPDKTLRGVAAFLSDPTFEDPEQMFTEMTNAIHDPGNQMGWLSPTGAATQTHPVVAQSAKDMLNKSENEMSGVLSTTMSFLTLYRDPVVARYTETSDFRVDDLMMDDSPVDLFMVVPPSDKNRLKPLVRLMLNQVIARRMESMAFMAGEVVADYRHRLLLLIDEFPSLGKMDVFAEALAFMAGYGLKAYLITQDLSQLYAAYTKDESIISNCHVRIAYAPNKVETAELLSKMTGITTVAYEQKSFSGNRFQPVMGHVSSSEQMTQRPLLTVDEAMSLPPSDMLIFVAGERPIYGKKIFYYKNPTFLARAKMAAPARSDIIERFDISTPVVVDVPVAPVVVTAQPAPPAQAIKEEIQRPHTDALAIAAMAAAVAACESSTDNLLSETPAESDEMSFTDEPPVEPPAQLTDDDMRFDDEVCIEPHEEPEEAERSGISEAAMEALQHMATHGKPSDDALDALADQDQIAGLL